MRGIQKEYHDDFDLVGIIPAHAGNTSITDPQKMDDKDHPRSCGEYT